MKLVTKRKLIRHTSKEIKVSKSLLKVILEMDMKQGSEILIKEKVVYLTYLLNNMPRGKSGRISVNSKQLSLIFQSSYLRYIKLLENNNVIKKVQNHINGKFYSAYIFINKDHYTDEVNAVKYEIKERSFLKSILKNNELKPITPLREYK